MQWLLNWPGAIDMAVVKQSPKEVNTFVVYVSVNSDYIEDRNLINEMAIWCKELTGNEYETWNIDSSGAKFIFNNGEDAMAFKLRWVE